MTKFGKLLTAAVLIGTPATALASPRTLMSGAPACGNTMGKGGYKDDCTAEERQEYRAAQAHELAQQAATARAKERAQRIAAVQREQQKQVKQLAHKADTVAEMARLTLEPLIRLRS